MDRMNFNKSIDFNDRDNSSFGKMNTSGTTSSDINNSPFALAVIKAKRGDCPVENNPLKEIMQEEGRNLSPSQVAREMLLNSKVIRRKDFTVQTLKAGSGMG